METMFGVTDAFVADQDAANHEGHTWIWMKRRQIDSPTIQKNKNTIQNGHNGHSG